MDRWVWNLYAVGYSAYSIIGLSAAFLCYAALAWWMGGPTLTWLALGLGAVLLFRRPDRSCEQMLSGMRARRLSADKFPRLHSRVKEIARSAGLRYTPAVYWVPRSDANAFVSGNGRHTVLGLSSRIIRELDDTELRAVLAHELSHIANNDLWVKQLVRWLALTAGLLRTLLLVAGPPAVALGWRPDPLGCLLIVAAPAVLEFLYQWMNRVRELKADLHAARLTGDPRAVAGALARIDDEPHASPHPLDTHPTTRARLSRLMELLPP